MPDDDEHALWTALLDDAPDAPDRTAPVDRLPPAFAAHLRRARDHVRHALVPVVRHTVQLHDAVHDAVFPPRARALARLADASLRFDDALRRDLAAAQSVRDDAERALGRLFAALDDLVRQSDLLFQAFSTAMRAHAQRLRSCTVHIPGDAERLIATLDNKAKHLGVQDHAMAKESLLRGILEKY